MKHLYELSNIGQDKKCLIVGGGDSLNRFEWDKLQEVYVICCNRHLSQMANMIIYYDNDMKDYFDRHEVSRETLLIGFKHKDNVLNHTSDKCTHFYNYKDMLFGDTGFHALQFADRVFNFNEIYLIGFDYTHNGKSYHHDEQESDSKKLADFEKWSIKTVLPRYKNIAWKNKIFNCNKDSELKIFPYGVPY